jgi:hypothetical protein
VAVLTAVAPGSVAHSLTGGLSLWAHESEKWCCPFCGGPVVREKVKDLPGRRSVTEKLMERAERRQYLKRDLGA